LTENVLGYILADFFQNVIWSPCYQEEIVVMITRVARKAVTFKKGQGMFHHFYVPLPLLQHPFRSQLSRFRVARWFIFKPKIPFWVILGGSCNGRCWSILLPFVLFYCHLFYFTAICSILLPFSIFCGHLE
jgi:hypothetical protein